MKRVFILALCSMFFISGCGNAETVSSESEKESVITQSSVESLEESDELWNKMNEAEEKIKKFLSRDEYKNAEKDKKTEMALQFLEELQKDGLIQHYDYFEDNEMISYNHFNGALGGISFRDFNEKIDGLAMN